MGDKSKLSPSRRRILALVIDGKSNREIAQATGWEEHSIRSEVSAIYRFYGVHGARGLFRLLDQIADELQTCE